MNNILQTEKRFAHAVDRLRFGKPVVYVYNPLIYTWDVHCLFIQKYGSGVKKVLFLGMNPGPFGMVQTGVPFGEVSIVKNWLKLEGQIGKPPKEHPRRPVTGFECHRIEVSGERLWGLFKSKFKTPHRFFKNHFVINYCPLAFLAESGKNLTPDKLSVANRNKLFHVCDKFLLETLTYYQPKALVCIGQFSEKRARSALEKTDLFKELKVCRILHPSPASPIANRGWSEQAEQQLVEAGIW